jgi:NTE family protein
MANNSANKAYDQVLYLLQGGGALGSYQVGVCEGLLNNNCEPDWIIGTSIGGLNGAIIAGNKPENRIKKLKEFWQTITTPVPEFFPYSKNENTQIMESIYSSEWSLMFGVNGFFKPRQPPPFISLDNSIERLSYYDTEELEKTLENVIDFDILNSKKTRLTIGAVCVEDGVLVRFDNFKQTLTVKHIMATAALPPGFPAIKVGDKYYWDGGLSSNTPLEVLIDEKIDQRLLCFVINLFSYEQTLPQTMMDILKRKKDIEFGSRYHTVIHYFCEVERYKQRLQSVFCNVSNPEAYPDIQQVCSINDGLALNLVRFHYRDQAYDSWAKDFEFSRRSFNDRFNMGKKDVDRAFKDSTWLDPISVGVQIHNF